MYDKYLDHARRIFYVVVFKKQNKTKQKNKQTKKKKKSSYHAPLQSVVFYFVIFVCPGNVNNVLNNHSYFIKVLAFYDVLLNYPTPHDTRNPSRTPTPALSTTHTSHPHLPTYAEAKNKISEQLKKKEQKKKHLCEKCSLR